MTLLQNITPVKFWRVVLSALLILCIPCSYYPQACCNTKVQYEIHLQMKGYTILEVGIPYSDWNNEGDQLITFKPYNKSGKYITSFLGSCAETDSLIKYNFKKNGFCNIKVKAETDQGKKQTKAFKISVDSLTIKSGYQRTILININLVK